jgi:hypothetical protein
MLFWQKRRTFALKFDVIKHWQKESIMWYADPLLGNDREISNYTTAVAK